MSWDLPQTKSRRDKDLMVECLLSEDDDDEAHAQAVSDNRALIEMVFLMIAAIVMMVFIVSIW